MWMSRTVSHMSMNEIDTPPHRITRIKAASSYAIPATADPWAYVVHMLTSWSGQRRHVPEPGPFPTGISAVEAPARERLFDGGDDEEGDPIFDGLARLVRFVPA